jgi:Fe-S-cluster containining protein
MRWYLQHEGTSIFIEDGDWYLHVENKCRQLDEANRCRIYPTRPDLCRGFETRECDFNGEPFDFEQWFKTPKALCEFANQWLAKRLKKKLGREKAQKKLRKLADKFGW